VAAQYGMGLTAQGTTKMYNCGLPCFVCCYETLVPTSDRYEEKIQRSVAARNRHDMMEHSPDCLIARRPKICLGYAKLY